MDKEFKHPQIFADLLLLSQQYYPLHNNLPKPFRFSVGEQLLAELADCLRYVILANAVNKKTTEGRDEGARHVRRLRASMEVIRGFMLLGWKLKFISHGAMAELTPRMESISKQAARWEQWLEKHSG